MLIIFILRIRTQWGLLRTPLSETLLKALHLFYAPGALESKDLIELVLQQLLCFIFLQVDQEMLY